MNTNKFNKGKIDEIIKTALLNLNIHAENKKDGVAIACHEHLCVK